MPANTDPIYGATPDVQVGAAILGPTSGTGFTTDQTGASTQQLIFQAGANGSFVDSVVLKAVLSPAATVARIFLCTATGAYTAGTTNTTANTSLLTELSLAVVTTSNLNAQNDNVIPIRRQLGPNQKLLISFGTSTGSAGTGYASTTFGSDY